MIALLFALWLAPPRPTLYLSVYPPIQIGNPHGSSYVRIRARVEDPQEQYPCAQLTLDYGDGCRSIEEHGFAVWGCDFYAERSTRYVMRERQHPYREQGSFVIVFTVKSPGQRTLRTSKSVQIGSVD